MLDLFCGRFGWGRAFAARGWRVVGFDLVQPPEIPEGCTFEHADILNLNAADLLCYSPDFICASSPCEEFSCWTMKMFQPNPKHPTNGIRLFEHTRELCEATGAPFVMENVRGAIDFVGKPRGKCGAFYLWGNAVPLIFPQGITKSKWFRRRPDKPGNICVAALKGKKERKALWATIPPELANCVAEYAERLIEAGAAA